MLCKLPLTQRPLETKFVFWHQQAGFRIHRLLETMVWILRSDMSNIDEAGQSFVLFFC